MRQLFCLVGLHGPFTYYYGRSPFVSWRRCTTCAAHWRGGYDGMEPRWDKVS